VFDAKCCARLLVSILSVPRLASAQTISATVSALKSFTSGEYGDLGGQLMNER
jgi:hypothetical protein